MPDEVSGQFHMEDVYLLLVIKVSQNQTIERFVHVWVGKYADKVFI